MMLNQSGEAYQATGGGRVASFREGGGDEERVFNRPRDRTAGARRLFSNGFLPFSSQALIWGMSVVFIYCRRK